MRISKGLSLATAVLMAGCASAPQPDEAARAAAEAAAQQRAAQARAADRSPITGSRLARGQNDRIVRAAGNAAVRSDVNVNSLGNETATPGR